MRQAPLRMVDTEELPDYPISVQDRLDSHWFVQWNLRRWEESDFRKAAYKDPEVGFYGLELIFRSHNGSPVGTLSTDDETLAFDLHISLEKWEALKNRKLSPLHNWTRVRCDNGEIRLAHPVVTEIVVESLKSKKRNTEKNAERRRNKRRGDLKKAIEASGSQQVLKAPGYLDRFFDWMEERYEDRRWSERFVTEAMGEFELEMCR